jgi:outer membrane protein TolC
VSPSFRIVTFFVWITCFPARGELTLTSTTAVQRALANNQLLAAGDARISSLEGLLIQSAARPNPRFFFQIENLRAWQQPGFRLADGTDTFFYLSQVVETAGKRSRRLQAAETNLTRGLMERELAAYQLKSRVRQAYWAAAGAQKSLLLLEDSVRSFEQTVTYHENRVREGAMAEVDLIRVRLELERLQISVNAAALEADRARIRLLQEMGEVEFPKVQFAEELASDVDVPPLDPGKSLAARPEVRLAKQAVDQARAQVLRQRAAAWPDVELLGGYKRSGPFDTLITGVQLNLPVADRNRGNIAAAESEVRAAERSQAALEALVLAEVRAAQSDFEIRRRQLLDILTPMRFQAAEAARIAAAAYREGGTDLLRLIDAERLRIETDLLYVRTLTEFRQSVVVLETALGVLK